ncbi:caspase family protein [Alienimonas californiensis]|uniref:Caspase domain protein n=1 Tax=Alienimonas californiensis TaxID=2527989 RepID=A0A517PBJ2_9PLAN|nr:caspase family protein [Alienimonas californiensis]QDT16754.1 Caspase domain protein [Alienimonas californiensis]
MADKALLCGVNNYRSISDLRGCLNDVANVKRLLTREFGFAETDVRTLEERKVTKKEVLKGWRWLLKDAGPGDRLVFHFSGHGSYTADEDGDEDDGRDELLCLYDMDWSKPDSYLLDDDIREELTGKLPEGAELTVLLDCCHSGTATRMLAPGGSVRAAGVPDEDAPFVDLTASLNRLHAAGRKKTRSSVRVEDLKDDFDRVVAPDVPADEAEETVLVRFVEPPADVRERAAARGGVVRSSLGRSAAGARDDRAGMNHVLLAGCRDTQTSADAYISDDFHGAFSYHLCETARRSGPAVTRPALMTAVRRAILDGGFSQSPQLEPEGAAGQLFGGRGVTDDNGATASVSPRREELQIELLQEILAQLVHLRGGTGPAGEAVEGRGADRHLVAVHGICRHDSGYSNPWWEALSPHLPAGLRRALSTLGGGRREVLWSDLVTSRSIGAATFAEVSEGNRGDLEYARLKSEIEAVLEDRVERQVMDAAPSGDAGEAPTAARSAGAMALDRQTERALFGIPGLDCVDDFVKYLIDDGVRAEVQGRFREVVVPLLESAGRVDVIAHSWGTVVAYEGLRALDGERTLEGEVGTFFTVGAALSIGPVKRRLRPGDGAKPRCVRTWVNLDAKGDPVGGPLTGRPYAVDHEFLNLHPTDCREILGLVAPACAHSSYFKRGNTAVNRDVFARFLTR